MSLAGPIYEIRVRRLAIQTAPDGAQRTVGLYRCLLDGVPRPDPLLAGWVAEPPGPGDNSPLGIDRRRIAHGAYPLWTQDGETYVTHGPDPSEDPERRPRPGLALSDTGARTEILIHPGAGFLSSTGCLNLSPPLPDAAARIAYPQSRRRVLALIEDLARVLGPDFPTRNGAPIPRAHVTIAPDPA